MLAEERLAALNLASQDLNNAINALTGITDRANGATELMLMTWRGSQWEHATHAVNLMQDGLRTLSAATENLQTAIKVVSEHTA